MIALADRLHRTISEIEDMPVGEFNEWLAYLEVVNERARNGK